MSLVGKLYLLVLKKRPSSEKDLQNDAKKDDEVWENT